MKLEDLKQGGLYRFTKATSNPQRDKRVARDWRAMDFPEGGELICHFDSVGDREGDYAIELQPYAGVSGAHMPGIHSLLCGWHRADGSTVGHQRNADAAQLTAIVLASIELFSWRDVDDALAAYNTQVGRGRPDINYKEVALTLLDESKEPTLAIFDRTRARIVGFQTETDGDTDYREHERRHAEFNVKALKLAPASAGDPEPGFTVHKGGAHECLGCQQSFQNGAAFTAHLPCKGKQP